MDRLDRIFTTTDEMPRVDTGTDQRVPSLHRRGHIRDLVIERIGAMVVDGNPDLVLGTQLVQTVKRIGLRIGRDTVKAGTLGKGKDRLVGLVVGCEAVHAMGTDRNLCLLQQIQPLLDLFSGGIQRKVATKKLHVVQPHPLNVANCLECIEVTQRVTLDANREPTIGILLAQHLGNVHESGARSCSRTKGDKTSTTE